MDLQRGKDFRYAPAGRAGSIDARSREFRKNLRQITNHPAYDFCLLTIWILGVNSTMFDAVRPCPGGMVMAALFQTLVTGSFCWFLASSLSVYPHSLSYFNESIGGPLNGPKHLLGSNVDWGQDLRYLKWWSEQNLHEAPLVLAYFGSVGPKDLGLADSLPLVLDSFDSGTSSVKHQCYCAISTNLLLGLPWMARSGIGKGRLLEQEMLLHMRQEHSLVSGGYSIPIYTCCE